MRWNSRKAFLDPARGRPNLRIVTDAQVKSLILEGRKVTGLSFDRDRQAEGVTAKREVLLAAGSIGSPQILQLSGIGPANILRDAGLAVHHELIGVGENLQDHLQIRTIFRIQNPTNTL